MNTFPPDTDDSRIARHRTELVDQGWTCVPGYLPSEQADAMARDIELAEQQGGVRPENTPFSGPRTWRVYDLLARGEMYRSLAVDPVALALAEGLLGADVRIYNASSIAIGPGESAQPVHCDDQVMHRLPRPHAAAACVAMWTLTEFTASNGGTVVFPGTHRLAARPEFEPEPPTPRGVEPHSLVAPKGSLLVWHGSLWHGAGENRTDRRRVAVAVNYCKSLEIVPPEQFRLGPLEERRAGEFSPTLLRLVGDPEERSGVGSRVWS